MRLQTRLSLSILPAILGPLLLIGGASYYQLETTARSKTLENMRTVVNQLDAAIEADISAAMSSVSFLAIASPITTYITAPDEDSRYGLYQPGVLALLTDYQTAYASNLEVRILHADGADDVAWLRGDSDALSPGAYADFVRQLRVANWQSLARILPAGASGEPLLVIGLRLSDALMRQRADGASPGLGYLVAVFDLKRSVVRADDVAFGATGGVILTDTRGQPWAGSSRPIPWNPAEALPDSPELVAAGPPVKVSANGVDRYIALATPHPGLLLVGDVASAEIGRAGQLIAVIVMALILLAVAAMHRLIYKAVRDVLLAPAESLISVAREMAAGNLQVPVQVDSSDELRDLGLALRELGNSLTESQESVALREAEREYAVEQLKGARDRAEAASRSKSEFLARMSHEIRTPMNGVLGMTELLGGTRLDRRQQQYAATIRHSAEGLLKIINDILDFSKIEAGKLELDDAPFDVEQVAEEAAELLAEAAHAKGIELICQLQPGLRATCTGDGMRLRQVLINLLGNAVKFTEQGQVILRVTEQEGGEPGRPLLRFEVEDTGIGIPPESQAAIFDSFSQADGSTTRRYGGTGLGLAISKQLIELMGGEIELQSTPGEGSTFGFTVPLARQIHAVSELKPEALTGSHILIVDDNATNRQILREHLQGWRAEVAEAGSGPQALAQLNAAAGRGEAFDLVVLDHQMPGMSGMDVLKAVRASPTLRDLRVVLLGSVARTDDDTEWRLLRVEACLTKPVRRAYLYTALSRVLADRPSNTQMVRALALEAAASAHRLGLRILLVEDNPVNQEVARGMLEQLGCEVTLAVDGEQGATAFEGGEFDVVLMDCHMPVLDGYGATARIRAYEKAVDWKRTPVVALTANALAGDREKCLEAGMDEYLSKPFTQEQLRRLLEALDAAPDEPPGVAPASVPARAGAVLDPRALEQIRALQQPGAPDIVAKVVALYVESAARLTEQIRTALAAGDADGLRLAAHALKSSSGNVGATGLADIARQLEAKGHDASLEAATELVEQMFQEHQRVTGALRSQQRAA